MNLNLVFFTMIVVIYMSKLDMMAIANTINVDFDILRNVIRSSGHTRRAICNMIDTIKYLM